MGMWSSGSQNMCVFVSNFRFFAKSGKQLKLSGSLKRSTNESITAQGHVTEEKSIDGFRLVHENTANVKSASTNLKPYIQSENQMENTDHKSALTKSESQSILPPSKVFTFDKYKQVDNKGYSQSPTSAFNWSKFKFAPKDGDSASDSEKVTSMKKSCSQPDFRDRAKEDINNSKNSKCVPKSESFCEIKREPSETVLSSNIGFNETVGDKSELTTNDTQSSADLDIAESCLGSSYPYSIDPECLPSLSDVSCMDTQSQQSYDSEDVNSQTSIQSTTSTQSKKTGLSIYFRKLSPDEVKGHETQRDLSKDTDETQRDLPKDTDETQRDLPKDTDERDERDKTKGIDEDRVIVIGSDDDDEPKTNNTAPNKVIFILL